MNAPSSARPLPPAQATAAASAAVLRGCIDLALARDLPVVGVDADGRCALHGPGVDVAWAPADVQAHLQPQRLTLVVGEPRAPGDMRLLDATDVARRVAREGELELAGHFAVVDLDLAARRVVLAVDRFGVRPLCFAREGTRVSFADRADQVEVRDRALDLQALYDYVHFHVIPAPRTVWRGVQRVEAGHLVLAAAAGLHARPARTTTFAARDQVVAADAMERFRTIVQQSVQRASGVGSVGCFLSGGTDSSTVGGMLARVTGGPVAAFSIGFDAAGYDEMAYARIAARRFGLQHHEYYVTPDDLRAAIPLVATHYDQPFGNSSAVPAYYCAQMAHDHGVARLLAGDGGDELFGGNTRYAKQKLFELYGSAPQLLRSLALDPLASLTLSDRLPVLRKAASYVRQARVPMPARMETYNLLERFGSEAVFTGGLLAAVDRSAPTALQREVYARCNADSVVDRMLAYDWRFTLADNDLPKVTGTTRLAGVAVDFPLLDDALVQFSMALPASAKVRGQTLRHFFKAALSDFLPPEILAKKKHGFGLPFGPWLVRDGRLQAQARDAVASVADRGLIRPTLVDDLFSTRLAEHAGYYGEMIWVLMMLGHWLDGHAPRFSLR